MLDTSIFDSSPSHYRESFIKNNYPELYQAIQDNCCDDILFREKIYLYRNNLSHRPTCPVCGNPLSFINGVVGYHKFCSVTCSNRSKDQQELKKQTMLSRRGYYGNPNKSKQTCLKKYGVTHAMKSEVSKQRMKDTCLERYGVEYSLQNENVRNKIKQTKLDRYGDENYNNIEKNKRTCLERYGVEYSFQDKNVRTKSKQTRLERYGDENYSNHERAKQTNLERYGVQYTFQSKEFKDKTKQTMLDRYGVEYASQSSEIKTKISKSKNDRMIRKNPNILQISNGIYTYKCPDPTCNKCEEKCFDIEANTLRYRLIRNTPFLCTRLYPHHISNIQNTSIEIFIHNILDEYNISYICNDRKILNGKELDIYIPSHNLAIECNGIHWHSSNVNNIPIDYHNNKYRKCLDNNIQLLSIWEDQIINYPEKIKSIILSKLGIYRERIYARKCTIKEVDSKTSRDFLDLYHLQGSINSSIRLGLYYNDELVSIMTFGKGRKCLNSSDSWELYRYCCKEGVQVIGGASKLFKYFINAYNPDQITSFSSNDISNGSLYKQLGFNFSKESLSYWYIDKYYNRYHRFNFIKSNLVKQGFDSSLTEIQIMTNRGFYCIYDTGQTKWNWSKEAK